MVGSAAETRRGVSDPRAARGRGAGPHAGARRAETAGAARAAADSRERGRLGRPAHRRALARRAAGNGRERTPVPRLAAAQGARSGRGHRHERARIPRPRRPGRARSVAVRAAGRGSAERVAGARGVIAPRGARLSGEARRSQTSPTRPSRRPRSSGSRNCGWAPSSGASRRICRSAVTRTSLRSSKGSRVVILCASASAPS